MEMTGHEHSELARRLYEHFNRNELDEAAAHAAEDVEWVEHGFGRVAKGRDQFVEFMRGWKEPFPDGTVEVVRQLAGDDGVTNECVYRATHTRPLETPGGSVEPTGNRIEVDFVEVWRIRDGKVVSGHNYVDSATIMRQLGLIS